MRKIIGQSIIITAILFVVYLIMPMGSDWFGNGYSTIVRADNNEILRVFLNDNQQYCFPPNVNDTIPQKIKQAVLIFEDEFFYYHPGVNAFSVFRALKQNIKEQNIVSGASTITMQVARLITNSKRTYLNKIREIFLAFKLEAHYSKNEILQLYLNHAPYGSNIQGYKTASYKYFDKKPGELSWAESATLAILPNAPGIIFPTHNNILLKQKRDNLLRKLADNGIINQEELELSILEPIPTKMYAFPLVAPHFSRWVKNRHNQSSEIRTTINFNLQRKIENIVKLNSNKLRNVGIKNTCVLVCENKTGKIKAYIGSQNFRSFETLGQVNGINAPRSSGSVLKPFLYALSIDEGIITPKTLLKDIPTFFHAFSPNNSNEKFHGVATVKQALTRSLNVPAVRLLNSYGVYQFYTFLKNAGVSTLFRQAEKYGLPLIIGGAEVNAFDVTQLYRGLANGGKFSPLIYRNSDTATISKNTIELISSGASYLTLDMLQDLSRPGVEYHWKKYQYQKPLAWKTGTSYGHKDAWAIGTNPQWTITVWVGNFDGEGNAQLSGTASAGPLLFDIFNALPHNPELHWFEQNFDDFTTIKVCEQTGFLAGINCIGSIETEAPIYSKPLRLCPFHKTIHVNKEETNTVCSHCWQEGYFAKKYLSYPPDVLNQLKLRGNIIQEIPEHTASCNNIRKEKQISFIYPKDSALIWMPRDFDGNFQRLVCKVAHSNSNKSVYWYLNDCYLGITSDVHTKSIQISEGKKVLLATDDEGNETSATFYVELRK